MHARPELKARSRQGVVPVLTALVVALVASSFPRAASAQPSVASKAAEARRIENEIETLGRRAEILIERYHEASQALDEASAKVYAARTKIASLRRTIVGLQAVADQRISDLYRGHSESTPLSYIDASTVREVGVADHYARTLASQDRDTIDVLTVRRSDLNKEEAQLESERAAVAAHQRDLRNQRNQVRVAMSRRQAALDQAKGELAALVEQERRRRAAEEARRAKEEILRRLAEQRRNAGSFAGSSPLGPVPPVSGRAGLAVAEARRQIDKPYQWGAGGPDSFDCSGLTSWAWRAAGLSLPHSSRAQFSSLPHVSIAALAPGDLVFYGHPIHHVGIFIGSGQMVNAPETGEYVRYDSIYRRDFAGAARP